MVAKVILTDGIIIDFYFLYTFLCFLNILQNRSHNHSLFGRKYVIKMIQWLHWAIHIQQVEVEKTLHIPPAAWFTEQRYKAQTRSWSCRSDSQIRDISSGRLPGFRKKRDLRTLSKSKCWLTAMCLLPLSFSTWLDINVA